MYGVLAHHNLLMKSSSSPPAVVTPGLLLHFDGDNNSTVFTDVRNHAFTAFGDAKISTAQSVFGGASGVFNGSTAYLRAANSSHFDLPGDFTIHTRIRFNALPSGGVMTIAGNYFSGSNGWALQMRDDAGAGSRIRFGWGDTTYADFAWSPSAGVWYTLTVSRVGSSLRIFIDGTQIGSTASFTQDMSGGIGYMHIGALTYSGGYIQFFNGYLDEMNLIIGAGVSANFTPPATAFVYPDDTHHDKVIALLAMNGSNASTLFWDQRGNTWSATGNAQISTAQSKFGGASALFDGTGDYITASNAIFNIAQGDFTFEAWVYPTSAAQPSTMSIAHFNAGSNGGLHIHRNTSGQLVVDNGLTGTTAGTISIPLDAWTHIAVERVGGTIYGFVGGSVALTHGSQGYTAADRCQMGRFSTGGFTSDYKGYIDDVRITKGVARYNGTAFTPPGTLLPV